MGSRLLPLFLAFGAILADTAGAHHLALWVVLASIPAAAAAAIVAVGDVMEGRPAWVRAFTCGGSLVFLLVGSIARQAAPIASALPPVAFSAVVGAAVLYLLPAVLWVLKPTPVRQLVHEI